MGKSSFQPNHDSQIHRQHELLAAPLVVVVILLLLLFMLTFLAFLLSLAIGSLLPCIHGLAVLRTVDLLIDLGTP